MFTVHESTLEIGHRGVVFSDSLSGLSYCVGKGQGFKIKDEGESVCARLYGTHVLSQRII